jgi:cell division transport system permease protein
VRHLISELRQGLRRNLSMHIAVMLTMFVSLTLVGFGVLMQKESDLIIDKLGDELQITVWLCKADDDRSHCVAEVTPAQQQQIEKQLDERSCWARRSSRSTTRR